MKVTLIFFFSLLILKSLVDGCPEPECPTKDLPSVNNEGKIVLTIFYDNDAYNSPSTPNTDLIKIVCDALDAFGDELEGQFKVGAGSQRSIYTDGPEFECLYDCAADCNDACAATLIAFFPTQVCCSKRGRDFFECAAEQNLKKDAIDTCVAEKKVCKEVLITNSDLRSYVQIDVCQLPIIEYNGKTDRCSKFKTSAEFISILCGIFKRGNINPAPCKVP